ncbi:lipid phosphate phosphatase 1 [Crucibulum laeve]|uniref:Lipid phosphate phosphatase 1 n=1 Tax=Crucibulum laeve TaxID=68775 RepID=A0A5C3M529_9AGAR|nr:lipid phosphate phosphatase 1 [Crucibulum laeve]
MNFKLWIQRRFGDDAFDWIDRSYATDWLFVTLIWLLSFVVSSTPVFERDFSPHDPLISHPHKPNQIGSLLNNTIALYVPILLILIWGTIRRSLREIHHGAIAVFASRGLARLITEFVKHRVGRLRPDFLARCKWSKALGECTGKIDKILDGRKSFPSGHSSTAFSGMVVLSLWLAGQTAAWCFHAPKSAASWRSSRMGAFALTLLPLFWATYVALTRVEDYRHHKEDVIVGSLIGILTASICYLIFWPNPFSVENHAQQASGRPRSLYSSTNNGRPNNTEFELTRLEDEIDNV